MTRTYDPLDPEYVPADEDAASASGLALAPWVESQAAPIRAAHIAKRMGETEEAARQKIIKWRRGECSPMGGRHQE